MVSILRSERALLFGALSTIILLVFGKPWLADLSNPLLFSALSVWIFGAMLWMSFAVVRHADCLASLLGEPLGTLILTVSVISIEVIMIAAIMLTGVENPTLARDTMFAVIMIVLNGMVGVSLIAAAIKHRAPQFNMQGANVYLGVLAPLALITLVLPRYTLSSRGGEASASVEILLVSVSIVLYVVFLGVQTIAHRGYFVQPGSAESAEHHDVTPRSIPYHAFLLPLTMLPIVLLAKSMAKLVDHGIAEIGAPQALGGVVVAVLVLSPEALAGFKSALGNQLQRTVNITYGSALATIGLTVPAVLLIGFFTDQRIELGLEQVEVFMLIVTLLTAVINASSGRTNILQGVVHLLLFVTYLVLIFD